jgi:uracil-DNA glycosylase family 4
MDAGGKAAALAALDWWRQSGVDVLVDERPRDWLTSGRSSTESVADVAHRPALPDSLTALHGYIADAAGADDGPPILPSGDPSAGLMLMAAMPTAFDTPQTGPFAGREGRLLDAMLGAIGRDRASSYIATLAPHRPAGGRIDPAALGEQLKLARRHIALAAPRALLLLGEDATRPLLDLRLGAARGRTHKIDIDGLTVNVVVTFHPQMLLESPARKAECWADLRRLIEELNR